MANRSYLPRLLSKAWAMTKADFGLQNARRVVIRATLTILVLSVLFMFGALDAFIAAAGKSGATLGVLAVALSFFYVLNLYRAAAEMQRESDDEVDRLKKKIDDKEKTQTALEVLWKLRSDGIGMRNEKVTTEDEYTLWRERYVNWRAHVLEEADKVNRNLRNYLERLDRINPIPAGLDFFDSGHHLDVKITSEILRRLERFLTKDLYDTRENRGAN